MIVIATAVVDIGNCNAEKVMEAARAVEVHSEAYIIVTVK